MSEAIDIIVKRQALEELKQLQKDLEIADMKLIEATEHALEFSNVFRKVKLPSDFAKTMDAASQASKKLNNQIRETADVEKKVIRSKTQLNKLTLSERVLKQKLTAQLKLEFRASTDLLGHYSKLSARFLSLQKRYQDLLAKRAQNVKLTKEEAAEFRKLSRQVPKMDKALKSIDATVGRNQRNVGNYTKVWAGLGGVMRQVLFAFGAYSALEIGRSIFNQVKEIDGLNKALAQVTETQERFNAEQRFLVDLSDEAGVELNSLQKAYTKFLASAKTTNLTIEDTRNIFRQTAKAGAVLGLSTDDINGSFRALEQILSKGKVQAEEIRGQLGERLPGAFQILAKSMGLTTAELSKQLELGNVISEEVLPGFAKELEKVYGLDTINKVDNLAAAQNRLTNEWNLFIREIESGEGKLSSAFKVIIESVSGMIKEFRKLFKEFGGAAENSEQNFYTETLRRIRSDAEKTGKTIEELAEEQLDQASKKLENAEKELTKEQEKLQLLKDQTSWAERFAGISKKAKDYEAIEEEIKARKTLIGQYKGQIKAAKELLLLKEQEDPDPKPTKPPKPDEIKAVLGSIAAYEQAIKKLQEQQQKLATTSEEYKRFQDQIDAVKQIISELNGEYDKFLDQLSEASLPEELPFVEAFKKAKKDIEDINDIEYFDIDEIELAEDADTIIRAEQNLLKQRLSLRQGFYNQLKQTALSTLNSIFQGEVNRYNDEIAANNEYFDTLLENERLTEEQRSQIEDEREQRNKELERRREEAERKSFLLSQAAALGEVLIETFKKVAAIKAQAAVLAANPVTAALAPLALSQIPFVIGSGAAAAAAIAATSIPQFKEGVLGFEGGWAWTGDGGKHEPFVDDATGKIIGISPNKPTLTYLPKGTSVFSSIDDPGFINHIMGMDMANDTRSLNQAAQAQSAGIEQAIKNMLSKVQNPVIHNHQKGIDYSRLAKELSKINKLESI